MRLIFLIFILACSQVPSSGEKFGKKVPERVVYGYWHEGFILLKEPGTNKNSDIILTRGEKGIVEYEAQRIPPGDTSPRTYLYIKTDMGHGWIKEAFVCSPPLPRSKRSVPKKWAHLSRHRCPIKRTLIKDRNFFSGKFETSTDLLTVTYHQGNVIYELNLKDPHCTKFERGRLKIKGNSATSRHLTMKFSDDYVDIKFAPDSDCPNFSKDFYHLLKGKVLTYGSHFQNGCNLAMTGIKRSKLLKMFYELKASVKDDDAITLSQLISFPIFTPVRSKIVEIKSPQQFIKLYPRITNLCFKDYIENLRLTDLNCGIRGITWGNGGLWILQKIIKIKFDNKCVPNQETYWN